MRAALVIAHPDDETLWGAGAVLTTSITSARWTVICCSIPRIDPVRAWKFHGACAALGAEGRVLPSVETEPDRPLRNLEMLDLSDYDLIVTHGAKPEPGYPHHHPHHKHVHEHVTRQWSHKYPITFGGDHEIALTREQLERKKQALRRYDHCMPYEGRNIPKWQALLHRYCEVGGYDMSKERYSRAFH